MKKITGKEPYKQGNNLISGSLHLKNDGLWYRFSTGTGGSLFELIKEAQGHNDFKDVIKEAKNYLGENYQEYQFQPKIVEKFSTKNDEVLIPAPENAKKFRLREDLYYKFRSSNNKKEALYEYRNIDKSTPRRNSSLAVGTFPVYAA